MTKTLNRPNQNNAKKKIKVFFYLQTDGAIVIRNLVETYAELGNKNFIYYVDTIMIINNWAEDCIM